METHIKLIEKQPEIAGKIDSLYGSGKRFAGVVLSTGGGKSFLAMDQIIKAINKHNQENNFEPNIDGTILSDCSILYFSPTHIVNGQFRTHMAKYIVAPEYLAMERNRQGEINRENAVDIMFRVLKKMEVELTEEKRQQLSQDLLNSIDTNTNPDNTIEELTIKLMQDELEKCDTQKTNEIVKKAFPNINFRAYKNLEKVKDDVDEIAEEINKEDLNDINRISPELVILDEAHRTGADTWWPKLQTYLQRQENVNVLAITATPERDVDSMNMMREISGIEGMGYSTRERRKEEYLAADYPLLKAIELGMVTPPEVVHFDMKLDETSEFKTMLRDFVLAYVNLLKQGNQRNMTTSNINANQKVADTRSVIEKALLLIMRSPFEDDLETTRTKILGEKRDFFDTSTKDIGLVSKMQEHIREAYFGKKVTKDSKANSPEMEQLVSDCYEFIQNYIWQDGKTWKQVKDERVSQLIEKTLCENGLEHGKALTFIESMPSIKEKETPEQHRERAKEYIAKQIGNIKKLIGNIRGVEPEVTALHSAAFTPAQNNDLLDEFRKADTKTGPFKIIASVQKFNEGFHPEGISAELMIKEISENKDKAKEPRIVLLQQLRKSYFCKKRC